MAKKFVRGVTGVDDIEKFDKSLTNVNDLISDGENTYVHTKKGKNEFYYKITDGVTSVNSTGGTITVEKSDDGSLKLDTNPQRVLEHDNLTGNTNYVKIEHVSGENTTLINSNQISKKFETVDNALLSKQNTLTAGDGINLNNNTISVIHTPESTVDCNNIITTQYVKIGYNSTNLPKGAELYGILTVVRIKDVVEQTYQDFFNGSFRYVRTGYNLSTIPQWNPWKKIVTESIT